MCLPLAFHFHFSISSVNKNLLNDSEKIAGVYSGFMQYSPLHMDTRFVKKKEKKERNWQSSCDPMADCEQNNDMLKNKENRLAIINRIRESLATYPLCIWRLWERINIQSAW